MAQECRGSLQVCRLRVARLSEFGEIEAGENNLYISDAIIQLGLTLVVSEGVDLELKNGCDDICATFQGDDRLKAVTLSMQLCDLDHELIELLTGSTLFTSGADSIGHAAPLISAGASDGVAFEVWTKRWNSGEQDGWWQWGFPKTKWRIGDITMENDFMRVPVEGKGFENSNFNNGPGDDWPQFLESLYGVFESSTIPDAQCGYLSTEPQVS